MFKRKLKEMLGSLFGMKHRHTRYSSSDYSKHRPNGHDNQKYHNQQGHSYYKLKKYSSS